MNFKRRLLTAIDQHPSGNVTPSDGEKLRFTVGELLWTLQNSHCTLMLKRKSR